MAIVHRTFLCSALVLLLLTLSGCGNGLDVVPVSGIVTRDGKPVEKLTLFFVPDSGRPSWGQTDKDGRFTLNYEEGVDGAKISGHTVYATYHPRPSNPQEEQLMVRGLPLPQPKELDEILSKYGKQETSPLKIQITKAVSDLAIQLD